MFVIATNDLMKSCDFIYNLTLYVFMVHNNTTPNLNKIQSSKKKNECTKYFDKNSIQVSIEDLNRVPLNFFYILYFKKFLPTLISYEILGCELPSKA